MKRYAIPILLLNNISSSVLVPGCFNTFSCTFPITASANKARDINTKPWISSWVEVKVLPAENRMIPNETKLTAAYSRLEYFFFRYHTPTSMTGMILQDLNKVYGEGGKNKNTYAKTENNCFNAKH